MHNVEAKLRSLGLTLPPPLKAPPGVVLPFQFVRVVGSAPGFNRQPSVINGFSDLILELYGPEVGGHCRSAVGLAELPFDLPVEIEGEVELS
jgi:hypothetical protein